MATVVDFRSELEEARRRENTALRRPPTHPLVGPAMWALGVAVLAMTVFTIGIR